MTVSFTSTYSFITKQPTGVLDRNQVNNFRSVVGRCGDFLLKGEGETKKGKSNLYKIMFSVGEKNDALAEKEMEKLGVTEFTKVLFHKVKSSEIVDALGRKGRFKNMKDQVQKPSKKPQKEESYLEMIAKIKPGEIDAV